MKVFIKDGKYNFVDRFNTLIGFDDGQSCCEQFGYAITPEIPDTDKSTNFDDPTAEALEPYSIACHHEPVSTGAGESGGQISFLLLAPNLPNLYLTLYNHHNGYYSHGFHMDIGGKRALDGSL